MTLYTYATFVDYTSNQGFSAIIPEQYLESFRNFQASHISYIGTFSVPATRPRSQICN